MTPSDKLIFLQTSLKSLRRMMNDQTSEIILRLNINDVKGDKVLISGVQYKKAYYEAENYFKSKEYSDSKILMRMIRTKTYELHKQGVTNTESASPCFFYPPFL